MLAVSCLTTDNFVDGVSITTTQNAASSRNPVWTFAAGVSDNAAYADPASLCGCPCTHFGRDPRASIVNGDEFVAKQWLYCNAGYHGATVPR